MSTLAPPQLAVWQPLLDDDANGHEQELDHKDEHDPYQYGWRERLKRLPNGEEEWIRTPLTLNDVLHPRPGDFRVHTEEHERFLTYLYNVLAAQVSEDPRALVMLDTRIGWDQRGIRPHSPDISLIFNVNKRRNWSTFYVDKEGTRPTLIIEVTSPGTRRLDLIKKLDQYEQVGVAFYIIVDTFQPDPDTPRQLIGWELTQEGYVAMPKNERGWLWLKPVGIWLALEETRLACYNRAGEYIEDYVGMMHARKRAEKRVAAEQARASEAESRASEAESRASEAESRASEAELRAAEEARVRLELETRLRDLEEKLRNS